MARSTKATALASGVVLAAALLAGATGVLADAAQSPGPGTVRASLGLGYSCQQPLGRVVMRVTASLPPAVTAGSTIRPAGARLVVSLPHTVVAELAGDGATAVAGSDRLTLNVAQGATAAATTWPGRLGQPKALPAGGDLLLPFPSTAPAVTVDRPGPATLTAAGLSLTLSLVKADGTPATPPAIAQGLRLTCRPAPGQDARVGTVQVAAAPARPGGGPSPGGPLLPGAGRGSHGPVRAGRVTHLPPGCTSTRHRGVGIKSCAWLTGYSDVRKLSGAARLGPGLISIDLNESLKQKPSGVLVSRSTGQLYYRGHHRLPPARATFLGFGFMPVTATLQLTELKPIAIVADLLNGKVTVTSSTTVSIRLYDVTVNGSTLNVGERCQTEKPVKLVLVGRGDENTGKGYTIQGGGVLAGVVRITRFAGCGVGENLDPLFTGSISGSGNFVKMTQGALCVPSESSVYKCPPHVREPVH